MNHLSYILYPNTPSFGSYLIYHTNDVKLNKYSATPLERPPLFHQKSVLSSGVEIDHFCSDLHRQVASPEGLASHQGGLSKGVPLYRDFWKTIYETLHLFIMKCEWTVNEKFNDSDLGIRDAICWSLCWIWWGSPWLNQRSDTCRKAEQSVLSSMSRHYLPKNVYNTESVLKFLAFAANPIKYCSNIFVELSKFWFQHHFLSLSWTQTCQKHLLSFMQLNISVVNDLFI